MAESLARQIVDAVVSRLGTIVADGGETYWYAPDRVFEWEALTQECLNLSVGNPATIYVVSPGDPEESTPATIGGRYLSVLPLDVSMVRWIGEQSDPFGSYLEPRGLVQDRMLRDVERRLVERVTTGSRDLVLGVTGALDLQVMTRDRSAENTSVPQWAIAIAGVRVQYTYSEGAP